MFNLKHEVEFALNSIVPCDLPATAFVSLLEWPYNVMAYSTVQSVFWIVSTDPCQTVSACIFPIIIYML